MENNNSNNKSSEDLISLQDLWGMFVPKWKWFLLSLVIALSVAFLYILKTPNVYTRSASILVKDDSKGGSASSALSSSDFSDLGMFKSNTNIHNEMLTISSPTLMTEVVKRLGLNDTYTVRKGLKLVQLYKSSPVAVSLLDKNTSVGFKIEVTDSTTFNLSDFTLGGEELGGNVSGAFNDTLQTPVGGLYLTATQNFNPGSKETAIVYSHDGIVGTTDYYTKKLRAELGSKEATIINLSIDDPSVQKAEDILNTLIEVYNENWLRDKNQIAVSTSQFIGDRLGVIENELGHVDENISSYKSEHLLPDVQAASNLYMTQSAENKKELLELNTRLSTAQYIRGELTNKGIDQPLPTNSDIGSANIENQISEYNQMVLDRNRLIANSSEKNPLVMDLASSLKSMQNTILQSVDNYVMSLNTQISSIRKQEATTTRQLASNPNQAKYLLSVERQQKVKEELYLYLLQKREENELSQAFTAYNTRVITAPRGSSAPTAPRKMNILLIAFALGLLVPAGIIYLLESMNTRVRGRKDLENMNIPFLGEIPMVEGTKKSYWNLKYKLKKEARAGDKYEIVVKEKNRNVINEAFRVVRTNLEFMANQETNSKIVMVSSMNPGSGKTFLTMNLAATFSIKDKKVAVVDFDLRRASMSTYVNKPKKGVANYLGGQIDDWKEIVVKNESRNIPDVLPVGTIPPNPSELLFSSRMETLISALREEYDLVFIDCPPVEIVADTSIIAKWADMTLFIVRAGLLERDMLKVVDGYYEEHKFNNMAMILNGTTTGFGGKYGSRYGYHYGYGSYGSYAQES
jgi:capsular exopolysaccharide family